MVRAKGARVQKGNVVLPVDKRRTESQRPVDQSTDAINPRERDKWEFLDRISDVDPLSASRCDLSIIP